MAEFLEGTVDAPVIGRVKKAYIIVPAGLAGAYVLWRWYQASRTDDGPAPDDGTYTTDDLSEYGRSTTGGAYNPGGNTGNTETDGTTPGRIDTNAQWTDKAVEKLTNQGFDGMTVSLALGEFLARRSLDKTEASIARAALAAVGQPPTGGPYPVNEAAVTGPVSLKPPTGLKATAVTSTSVTLTWNKVDGAGYYRIYHSGSMTNVGATDGANTSITIGGLKPSTTYKFAIATDTTTAVPGQKSPAITVKTKGITLTRPTGLRASSVTRTSFRVSCSPVKGAEYYRWYVNGSPYGASDQPYRDFTSRRPNTSYKITVTADTTNQAPGPVSSPLTVKTRK
jgi:hypothetical protein